MRIWLVLFGIGLAAAIAFNAATGKLAGIANELGLADAGEPDATRTDIKDGPRTVRLRKRESGRFVARAEVNGAPIDLAIDSGATTVLLRHADAELAGIDTSALAFTTPVETANGTAFTASVRLRQIAIGPIRIEGVEALVAKPGTINESLLGMSFLRRLRSYELSGDFLTLRD